MLLLSYSIDILFVSQRRFMISGAGSKNIRPSQQNAMTVSDTGDNDYEVCCPCKFSGVSSFQAYQLVLLFKNLSKICFT